MTEKEAQEARRHKRVGRLKKAIVGLFVFAVLAPVALSVIFSLRMNVLEKSLKELNDRYGELLSRVEGLSGKDDEKEALPAAADVSENGEEARKQESEETVMRRVYLTFDDGPSTNTDNILDILSSYGVKATFFVTGKEGAKAEASYRRIVEEGHTLGMHSYTHDYSRIYTSEEAFMEDMDRLKRYLYDVTGVQSTFIRFPGGSSNKVSDVDMRLLIEDVHKAGWEYFDWNVSSQDASSKPLSKEEILDNCLNSIERFDNCIILMHDAGSKNSTVEALPELIEHIQAMEHTELLPITEDTVPVQHIKMTQEETED